MSCTSTIEVTAEGTFVILGQLRNMDNTYVQQADVDAIEYILSDITDVEAEEEDPVELVVADVIYDTLQTSTNWTLDSAGYNFAYKTAVPTEAHTYKVKVKITLTNGDVLVIKKTVVAV